MEFFIAQIPGKDDLKESSENNSNILSGFVLYVSKYLSIVFGIVIFHNHEIRHR